MKTVSDFVLERLSQWGVRRVYGYPGDGINGLIGAFGRTEAPLGFLQTRQEDALLASKFGATYESYAKRAGRLVPRFATHSEHP